MESSSPSFGRGQRLRAQPSKLQYLKLGDPSETYDIRQPQSSHNPGGAAFEKPVPKPRKSLTNGSVISQHVSNLSSHSKQRLLDEQLAKLLQEQIDIKTESEVSHARTCAVKKKLNLFKSLSREMSEDEKNEVFKLKCDAIDLEAVVIGIEAQERSIQEKIIIQQQLIDQEYTEDPPSCISVDELTHMQPTNDWIDNQNAMKFSMNNNVLNTNANEFYPSGANLPPAHNQEQGIMMQLMQRQLELISRPSGEAARGDKELPFFGGQPEDWSAFIGEYDRTTKQYRMQNSENLRRLRKSLKGTALDTVKSLMANPENVPEVIKTLKIHFGRPELINRSLIKKARDPKSPEVNKPETWITFAIAVQSLVVNIQTYSTDGKYLNDTFLLDELVDKLPVSMQKEWIIWRSTNYPKTCNLEIFCEWMNIQRETACVIARLEIAEDNDGRRSRRRGAGVHVMTEENQACINCEKTGHTIEKCYQFKKKTTEDRWNLVKEKRLCFLCLCAGHNTSKCSNRDKCGQNDCDKKHHPLLHRSPSAKKSEAKPVNEKVETPEEKPTVTSDDNTMPLGSLNAAQLKDSLPIIPVFVKGPNGTKKIYALLDSGASCSIIEDNIIDELGLQGVQRPFRFTVFGKGVREHKTSMKINALVSGAYHNARFYEVNDIRTIPKLGISGCGVNVEKVKVNHPHLQRLRMQSFENAVPQMIIGFDNNRLSAAREILENNENKEMPTAYKCLLGWYLCSGRSGKNCFHVSEISEMNEVMHEDMKRFFFSENFGVKLVTNCNRSIEDRRALSLLIENTKRVSHRWELPLLWKQDNPTLPESYSMALNRLKNMERKMDRDPVFAKLVMEKFTDYMAKGYLVKRDTTMSDGETFEDSSGASASTSDACRLLLVKAENETKRWYLPWFFAYHPTKKPRLVFDAAAQSHKKSLNDFLLKGPDLLQPLVYVLIRFRRHLVAITGDIAEMFHQVRLSPSDRKSQTVLYRGMDRTNKPCEYEFEVLFFGSACSPASAIYAKDTNAKEYEEKYGEAVKAITLDHYMDDYCGGCSTVSEAINLRRQISYIHSQGRFKICKWSSNSSDVLETIPVDVRAEGNLTISDNENCDKLLGMLWNPTKDVFMFNLNFRRVPAQVMSGDRLPTKRELASVIMSLFDPLGFLCPLKVKALVMLQETWKSGVDWDQVVNTIEDSWKDWLKHLHAVEKIAIPRIYYDGIYRSCDIEMHTFVDASQEASTAAVYLLFKTGGSVVKVVFVMGKVRVAPIRGLTIPRMELQGAVMGARLSITVENAFKNELKISRRVFWTDSKTVLCWLRSTTGKFNQFVSSRIGEIQEITDVSSWRWVPTKLNVADDATRSKEKDVMTSDSRWLNGPSFLYLKEDEWPNEKNNDEDKSQDHEFDNDQVVAVCFEEKTIKLPDINRFSSWMRLICSTAIFIVFSRWIQKKLPYEITPGDMKQAERIWIKKSQQDTFPDDLSRLKSGQPVSKQSRIYKLSPKLNEDGIIVLSGRIQKAEVPTSVKTPPILDSKHPYAELFVAWHHQKSFHFGQERVLNELRQHVWILNARMAVRKSWANCNVCIFRRSSPIPPEMGQLPSSRLETGNAPFNSTGVDYFGPFLVTVKRSTEKRWGVLFTCLATRAVHLELAESLDTNDMLNALVRFVSLRGSPQHIWSDNGTNFVGAKREMEESFFSWKNKPVEEFASVRMIQWHFIPPASPHMGGSWERLVGSTKRILNIILKEQNPREGTLRTLFAEVMNILNSRPLTHVPDSPDDLESLTPNHILRMSCVTGPTIAGDYSRDDQYKKSWRYGQYLAEQFWSRFKKEYIPTLARRGKWYEKARQMKVGDLVLVVDDQQARNMWRRGIITKVFPSKNGQTRIVEVKVAHVDPNDPLKAVKNAVLQRSVMKLCLLSFQKIGGTTPGRENVAEK